MPEPREFRAPGRVNLIGGQVDYHEGWVVSMAIDRDVHASARPRADGRITARSRDLDGAVDIACDATTDPRTVVPAWGRTVAGVASVLTELGCRIAGADLEIASTVPIGAGLSSSAAFEVACALALVDRAGFALAGADLARAAQRAEHVATGVPCGIQDQMTSVCNRDGHAIFLDCRTLEIEHVPLPAQLRVLVVHSGVPRVLEATPYAQRRAESEAVAAQLGVRVLRDASLDQVRDLPRGRHAVTEMARVRAFAGALRAHDLDALGPLMLASHASSRDDMGVSIPELDILVDALVGAGALGARLTGAGFGGCVVALAPAGDADAIAARATAAYRERTGRAPVAWVVRAAAGAGAVRAR
ncbi:MAG TPA: galactokinase family protein [Acidimicrobiia bacterium]|nr:galactokinase family protein [Acidimicrobiia bacterium]